MFKINVYQLSTTLSMLMSALASSRGQCIAVKKETEKEPIKEFEILELI